MFVLCKAKAEISVATSGLAASGRHATWARFACCACLTARRRRGRPLIGEAREVRLRFGVPGSKYAVET